MKQNWFVIFMGVLFLGSIWGILEATMGNVLHWIGLHPYTGLIMTSIGTGLMSFARRLYRVRGIGIFMGFIAAGFKAIDFLIPGSNVLRPIVAIILTALAFESIMAVADKVKQMHVQLNKALAGFALGYVSLAAFAYFTAYALKFNYWLKMGALGILKYLGTEGWKFGIGAMLFMLLGYNFVPITDKLLKIRLDKIVSTNPFYAASGTFTIAALIFVIVV